VSDHWQMVAGNTENIAQFVVIPAYSEKDMLSHHCFTGPESAYIIELFVYHLCYK
jgi:hypothetical protein